MFDRVKQIIEDYLQRDDLDITPETDMLTDLHINSLELVELVCTFEIEFGLDIPEKDIRGFQKVSDIVSYLEIVTA